MIDEYFEMFLDEFGQPTEYIEATEEQVKPYRGILPDRLLEYWQNTGFSGFQNGLFWITNPAEFEEIVDAFLEGTDFSEFDNYHVIARNAYGVLYLWGERTGHSLTIMPHLNWIKTSVGDEQEIASLQADSAIESFFGVKEPRNVDIKVNSKPLFPSVVKKHGPVNQDEVMVFTPYLFMGGEKSADKMSKENLHSFLQIIADLGGAEVIDMASMVSNTVKHFGE
ncbi:GAD-like domain-containing protein [Vibrio sp. ABG19]|uniref:GAD-like domain-containing protein n=1 Tax=Vibrio sp. ABG19 TaxID=2817385 RepID=UPI00249DCE71|nr:GAD-like domain-containing protein [Vibrio sp. ABG19]WGY45658.1 DUF1851 domain-containing protein [Vibrio sp. ABG19]